MPPDPRGSQKADHVRIPERLAACAVVIALYMTAWFVVALVKKDNSVADIAWGLGFVLVAVFTFFRRGSSLPAAPRHGARRRLGRSGWPSTSSSGTGSAARILATPPGGRKWGRSFVWRSYLQVFLLQGFFLLVIASPVILVNVDRGLPVTAERIWHGRPPRLGASGSSSRPSATPSWPASSATRPTGAGSWTGASGDTAGTRTISASR